MCAFVCVLYACIHVCTVVCVFVHLAMFSASSWRCVWLSVCVHQSTSMYTCTCVCIRTCIYTVLFIENRPVGSQSVSSQSTVVRLVSRTVSRSAASRRHNYAVLKFNVQWKRWCTQKGSAGFDHQCPPLAKWARLVIERHEILPVDTGGQPWEKTASPAINQLPFGRLVGRSVSQSVYQHM